MAAPEKVNVNLLVGNQYQQLTVPLDKERYFRDAADLINDRFNKYRQGFQNQSTDRYNAVVMLDIAVRYLQQQEEHDTLPFVQAIGKLTEEIEEVLEENR